MESRRAGSLVLTAIGVALTAGCVVDDTALLAAADDEGAIWIEPAATGGYLVVTLPAERGAAVEAAALAAPPPWYVGPGVYILHGGECQLAIDGAATRLDEVLMVWDPAPRARS